MKCFVVTLLLLAMTGCRGSAPASGGPGADASPITVKAPPIEVSASCAERSRGHCAASPDCTLELDTAPTETEPAQYSCRPAQGACEEGFVQDPPQETPTEEHTAACTRRPGCQLHHGDCYCPCHGAGRTSVEDGPEAQSCECTCAGGPPPTCSASER